MEMCENEIQLRKCPKCGKLFSERGAVSRVDNVTIICSDCGTREALESIGVDEKGRRKFLIQFTERFILIDFLFVFDIIKCIKKEDKLEFVD